MYVYKHEFVYLCRFVLPFGPTDANYKSFAPIARVDLANFLQGETKISQLYILSITILLHRPCCFVFTPFRILSTGSSVWLLFCCITANLCGGFFKIYHLISFYWIKLHPPVNLFFFSLVFFFFFSAHFYALPHSRRNGNPVGVSHLRASFSFAQ